MWQRAPHCPQARYRRRLFGERLGRGSICGPTRERSALLVPAAPEELCFTRNQQHIDAGAVLDGIHVLAPTNPPTSYRRRCSDKLQGPGPSRTHFRWIKVDDLDLRPVYHRLKDRVKAHVLICLLACHLVWHVRQAWAPLTFTDEHPPVPTNPVASAQRSRQADLKAHRQHDSAGDTYRGFGDLLDHLAPSPATRSASPAPPLWYPCSPTPPPTNAAPSNCSTSQFP